MPRTGVSLQNLRSVSGKSKRFWFRTRSTQTNRICVPSASTVEGEIYQTDFYKIKAIVILIHLTIYN